MLILMLRLQIGALESVDVWLVMHVKCKLKQEIKKDILTGSIDYIIRLMSSFLNRFNLI